MNDPQVLDQLGERCAVHLENEALVLKEFVRVCSSIRESLGIADEGIIEKLKKEQTRIEQESRVMNQGRIDLRKAIAEFLDRPVEATSIKALEDHLTGEMASRIARLRGEVEGYVCEIQDLSRSNAILLQHNIDIFHRMLLSLSGQDQCQTYSPNGTIKGSKLKSQLTIAEND